MPVTVDVGVEDADHVIVIDDVPGSEPLQVPVLPGGRAVIPPQPGWTPGTTIIVYTDTVPIRAILIEIVSLAHARK